MICGKRDCGYGVEVSGSAPLIFKFWGYATAALTAATAATYVD